MLLVSMQSVHLFQADCASLVHEAVHKYYTRVAVICPVPMQLFDPSLMRAALLVRNYVEYQLKQG